MYDDTMAVDKAYYNELKDKAAACEFWYQEYYSLYLRLAGLRDRIEQAKFFNQRAGRELWNDKPKDVQDRDVASAEKLYDELLMLIEMHADVSEEKKDEGWISVKDRLPETKMDNVLFTLYTPAWHDLTDDFPEDERDFPEEYVTVCGWFEVFKNGDRYWNWLTSDGYHGCIRNEYEEAHLCNGCKTGEITYITHWMPLPEPPEREE